MFMTIHFKNNFLFTLLRFYFDFNNATPGLLLSICWMSKYLNQQIYLWWKLDTKKCMHKTQTIQTKTNSIILLGVHKYWWIQWWWSSLYLSNIKALKGIAAVSWGGGTRSTIAFRISVIPIPSCRTNSNKGKDYFLRKKYPFTLFREWRTWVASWQ